MTDKTATQVMDERCRTANSIAVGVAKLLDKHRIPPVSGTFWVELQAMIELELEEGIKL